MPEAPSNPPSSGEAGLRAPELGGRGAMQELCSIRKLIRLTYLVRAAMTVRPEGELRLVQSSLEGSVVSIEVKENQKVKQGQTIARLDSSKLRTQQEQLEESLNETQKQIEQIDAQIELVNHQIATEDSNLTTALTMAEAQLAGSQRNYSDLQSTSLAGVREAEANLQLAEEELISYAQLVESGAIAQLQLTQKQAAAEAARAQLDKLTAALNPTNSEVTVAQEKIAQAQSQGSIAISQFRQTQSQLMQQRSETKATLNSNTQELKQVIQDLVRTEIQAPIAGTVQSLSLRNIDQVIKPSETIAKIFPNSAELKVQALVPAKEISKVQVGQIVKMRLSACPFSQFGTLPGVVSTISPDAFSLNEGDGKQVGGTFYTIAIQPQQLALKAGEKECSVQAGIEGRADIITRKETVLDFILRKANLSIKR
jgi:HlyD family secretion protein